MVFSLLLVLKGFGQTQIAPEALTLEDGLSQGFISTIYQDQEGFIWVGTKNGLNRYDGEKFEVFTNQLDDPYSIAEDFIEDIEEYGDYLIIVTKSGEVELFHKRLKRFYTILNLDLSNNGLFGQTEIGGLVLDDLQQLWVVDGDAKLFRLQFPANFWEQLPYEEQLLDEIELTHFPDIPIRGLKKGVGTTLYGHHDAENQYVAIDIHTGKWQWPQLESKPKGLQLDQVLSFDLPTNNEMTWISPFDSGKVVLDFPVNDIHYLWKKKQLWLVTPQEILLFDNWSLGVHQLRKSEADAIYPNAGYRVPVVYSDRSDIIWIGTGGYGVLKVNPRQLKIKTYFKDISVYTPPFMSRRGEIFGTTPAAKLLYESNQYERSFSDDLYLHRTWWLAGKGDTLYCISKRDTKLEILKVLPDGQSLFENELPITQGYYFHTAYKDPETDLLWMAQNGGILARYNPDTKAFKVFDFGGVLPDGYDCYTLAKTANQHWWIGTSAGLVHGTPNGDALDFELLDVAPDGLLNDKVSALWVDQSDGHLLWIGTKGGGLQRLDTRTGTFTHWTERTGLPNDVIYGVLQSEDGTIWMSSNKGIINLDPATNTVRNFTKADGMQSDEFNTWAYAKAPTGEFLFGGVSGLNVFHPDDLASNPVLPKVWITGIRLNNQAIEVGDSTGLLPEAVEYTPAITVPFAQNSITLEFAGLEFTDPQKNRFRYYLEGAESA
ncbi:MAG: two-component regulator propeller domain-containing protein, partial [Bacteroidota bacterium]